jgi:hypothetical protein
MSAMQVMSFIMDLVIQTLPRAQQKQKASESRLQHNFECNG